ncbi:catalase A [Coemansia sp. BCRC 34301]|nr:catalase A [Coemansia sp. BCRC 34301]
MILGIKNLTTTQAAELTGTNPNYATQDLFEAIERGNYPPWTVSIQAFTEEEALKFSRQPEGILLHEVGRMVLNHNPKNYFAKVEQAAFSPSHMVPGIAPSPDRMLQGRLFSYPDTHRHCLGANYLQLPINCPIAPTRSHQRDGPMVFGDNGGRLPNYEPNSFGGPQEAPSARETDNRSSAEGLIGRHGYQLVDEDFDQPRALYRLLSAGEQQDLVDNIAGSIAQAKPVFQRSILPHIYRIDSEFGSRVETILKSKMYDQQD